jgi:repressor LexA
MNAQIISYNAKKHTPVIDLDWMAIQVSSAAVEIPVMGTVAAGEPIEAISYSETLRVPEDMIGRRTYALRVEGHSMVDENIQHGDFIVIEAQETAENGETVVALINNDAVTLKKLYIERDHIRLQPANSKMRPIVLRNDDVRILGVVCAVIRKYGNRQHETT